MNENLNLNSDSLSGAISDELGAAGGTETVSGVASDALTLEELNQTLGKNFADKASALKAFKDTFSYVGKLGQEVAQLKRSVPQNTVSREDLEAEFFYKDNPDHAKNREIIEALAFKKGMRPQEVVNDPSYKEVYEKVSGYEKSQAMKSVLESNPRLGSARNKIQEAGEALASGDRQGASRSAVAAVLEAYEG